MNIFSLKSETTFYNFIPGIITGFVITVLLRIAKSVFTI